MRHAKSDHGAPSLADHERPLNPRGRRDAPRMARWLAEQDLRPDQVLSSTSQRTRETLDLMVEAWRQDGWETAPEAADLEGLYLASAESMLWTIVNEHAGGRGVLVLGHNPGVSMLASALTGQSLSMPTAAIAVLEVSCRGSGHPLDGLGAHARCQLVGWGVPKQLSKSCDGEQR
jgi:phosphohistidine phosphatase